MTQKVIDTSLNLLILTVKQKFILNYIQDKIVGGPLTHKKCSYCNNVKADVILRCDPFDAEIYEDYTNHLICNSCVSDREDEI